MAACLVWLQRPVIAQGGRDVDDDNDDVTIAIA